MYHPTSSPSDGPVDFTSIGLASFVVQRRNTLFFRPFSAYHFLQRMLEPRSFESIFCFMFYVLCFGDKVGNGKVEIFILYLFTEKFASSKDCDKIVN